MDIWETMDLGLGPTANIVGLIAGLIAIAEFARRAYSKVRHYREARGFASIAAFVSTRFQRESSELLRELRLAIIDDEPDSFPIRHLESLVAELTVIKSIGLSEISSLGRFDIILLDVAGVLREDARNGGAEILRRLRDTGQEKPYVIAVSSKRFTLDSNRYFKLADDVLNKPLSPVQAEEALLQLVSDRIHPVSLARKADSTLVAAGLSGALHRKAVSRSVRFLVGGLPNRWLRAKVCSTFGLPRADEFESALRGVRGWLRTK